MSELIGKVNEMFEDIKTKNSFVVVEKHGGALRNSYDDYLPGLIPDIVLSDTSAWSQCQPGIVFAAEDYSSKRDDDMEMARSLAMNNCIDHISRYRLKPSIVYSWFNSVPVNLLAETTHVETIVSRDEDACSVIEDKARLFTYLRMAGCAEAAMPRHDTFTSATQLPNFESIEDKLNLPFVMQGRSMGGDGTFIISSEAEFSNVLEKLKGSVRISEFIDSPYSSIYCLSLPDKASGTVSTYVDAPSYKPIAIDELGIGNVMGAGGDWRAAREDCNMSEIISNIHKLAQFFYEKWGYYGHFVIEGFHKDGLFLFNEINARPGGGSEVNSCYQFEYGTPSFTSLHILGRLGLINSELFSSEEYNYKTIERVHDGTQNGAVYLKYKNRFNHETKPTNAYKGSGVYKLIEDDLIWKFHDSASRRADLNDFEYLLANGPKPEVAVVPGKQICTIEGYGSSLLLDKNLQLNKNGQALVAAAHRLFGLKDQRTLKC